MKDTDETTVMEKDESTTPIVSHKLEAPEKTKAPEPATMTPAAVPIRVR